MKFIFQMKIKLVKIAHDFFVYLLLSNPVKANQSCKLCNYSPCIFQKLRNPLQCTQYSLKQFLMNLPAQKALPFPVKMMTRQSGSSPRTLKASPISLSINHDSMNNTFHYAKQKYRRCNLVVAISEIISKLLLLYPDQTS